MAFLLNRMKRGCLGLSPFAFQQDIHLKITVIGLFPYLMHDHFIAAVHQVFPDVGSRGYEDQAVVFQRHCMQRLHPGMKRKIAEILF